MTRSSGKDGLRADSGGYVATGYQMIRSITVENFRCYRTLSIDRCARLNVIVGDNGVGKTALLEAIFMALAATTELAVRFRNLRGLEGNFSGSPIAIMDAIFGDFFHNNNLREPIRIALNGNDDDKRSLIISRGGSDQLQLSPGGFSIQDVPLMFEWTDSVGRKRYASPQMINGQIQLPGTGEDLPNFYHFFATQPTGSVDVASRFSELSKRKRVSEIVTLFRDEFHWIEDLDIEVQGGAPAVYASVFGSDNKMPVANISGAINRIIGIMVTMASREKSCLLIDEIENGVHYSHHQALWAGLLSFMRRYDSQLFVSTHSLECLRGLVAAAGTDNGDISLWRVTRDDKGAPSIALFDGDILKSGIEFNEDVR